MRWLIPLALLSATSLARPRTIRMATLAPKGTDWHKIIVDMNAEWKAKTGGRVTLFPGGTMGDELQMVQRMRANMLQAAVVTITGLAAIEPELEVFLLPRLLTSNGELDYVLGKMRPSLDARLEKRGFKVLNWLDAGWVHFFAKKKLVHPDDLKLRKVFVWNGRPKEMKAWNLIGAKPVPLQVNGILIALRTGQIDLMATTPLMALASQWFPWPPR